MHRHGMEARIETGIGEIENRPVRVGNAMKAIDTVAERFDFCPQAEPLQSRKAGRLQHQARAERQ